MDTPEALTIRTFNPLEPSSSLPVEIITEVAGTSKVIVDRITRPDDRLIRSITIQNRSVQPCFYQHDGDASANGGVLGGGAAANDGYGGRITFNFQKETFKKLSFISITGALNIQVEKLTVPSGL